MPTLTVLHPLLETGNDVFALEAKYFIPKFSDLSSHEKMVGTFFSKIIIGQDVQWGVT